MILYYPCATAGEAYWCATRGFRECFLAVTRAGVAEVLPGVLVTDKKPVSPAESWVSVDVPEGALGPPLPNPNDHVPGRWWLASEEVLNAYERKAGGPVTEPSTWEQLTALAIAGQDGELA